LTIELIMMRPSVLRCAAAAGAAAASLLPLRAQDGARDGKAAVDAMWRDPVFQKQFVAGYGVNADIEPRVSTAEVAVLEKVRPLMSDNDKLPQAETALAAAIKPESSAMLDFTLGGLQFQMEKGDLALANFDHAVKKFPSFRRAWRNIGFIHVRAGRFVEAIAAFTKFIELGGNDAVAYGLLGYAYSNQQDWQPAEAAYRNALLLDPGYTEWRLGLTRCVYRQEKFEDAASLLDALLARYPEKGEFWLLQAHTYLGSKQPLKAAVDLELLDRLGKSTVDSLSTLGDVYVGENLMDLAAGAYMRALDVDPNQPLARALRDVELLAARGAPAAAQKVAAKLHAVADARMEPAEKHKLLKIEARLALGDGQSDGNGAKVLEEIVALDPLDGEALLLLAQHWQRQNEPDRAILCCERAEGIEAFEANARIRHAQILVHMGRYPDALPLLRRAQEIKPRDDVARYLEQVERAVRARR
jgi:tetratricopeptide (TPR) repeat protein